MVLTHEQGYKLLSEKTNENNLKSFKEILPNFFLDSKSNTRIINNLKKESRNEKEQYADDLFNMDAHRRTFLEIPKNKDTDEGYRKYYSLLDQASRNDDTRKKRDAVRDNDLFNYDIYTTGKVTVGKQQCKLFKFLLQKKLLTKQQIEEITTIRQVEEKLYIVISRNPIDYLFCSTNQSFTSCLDLQSGHSEAFYMGLPGATLDPNRVITMLTDGKTKEHTIKSQKFEHFKVLSRSWGIIGHTPDIEKDIFNITKYYPNQTVKFGKPISKAFDLKINNTNKAYYDLVGKFTFDMPMFKDGLGESFLYLDNFGIREYESGRWGYTWGGGGSTGCIMKSWRWGHGFEGLKTLDNLDGSTTCTCCSRRINTDDARYVNDDYDQPLCNSCYSKKYFHCDNCHKVHEISEKIVIDSGRYCKTCYDEIFGTCDECGKIVKNDKTKGTEGYHCIECYEKLFTRCSWCGESVRTNSDKLIMKENEPFCDACHFAVHGENGNEPKFEEFDIMEAC